MRIHDISQPLGSQTATWPGDFEVDVQWSMRIDRGDAVNVATLMTSVHAGTHVDGFLHVAGDGATAAQMPLDAYLGPCVVVDAIGRTELAANDVAHLDLASVQRVLFRTRASVDETRFPASFAHISPALARELASAGVRLVGTDAPSVDPVDSKTLDAHHALAAGDVAILENVVLSNVEPGAYTLIALPLRLVEADSSPVRAVLVEGDMLERPGPGPDVPGRADPTERHG
ncbi:MAG TPA: arylformamidase [Longimicrobiales bacterium]|nr:arylformamidase [Longimicrobiales bacterium]